VNAKIVAAMMSGSATALIAGAQEIVYLFSLAAAGKDRANVSKQYIEIFGGKVFEADYGTGEVDLIAFSECVFRKPRLQCRMTVEENAHALINF